MHDLHIKQWNHLQPYTPIWEAMRQFTEQRLTRSPHSVSDEIWILQHEAVFTLGQAGKPEHILNPQQIPIVQCDRGGQVTYHGPGQLMLYTLLDLNRLGLATTQFVHRLENCIIDYLKGFSIMAERQCGAPGVYVDTAKISSIGLRVKKGLSYHGLAFNVDMDLTPFSYINPCGFKGLKMTQLSQYVSISFEEVVAGLITAFKQNFGYNQVQFNSANGF